MAQPPLEDPQKTQSNTDISEDWHRKRSVWPFHGRLKEETVNPMEHIKLPVVGENGDTSSTARPPKQEK